MGAEGFGIEIDPVDTLMFRDGRPFSQSDPGASAAVSMFPPFSPTLVGAVRAALWKELGKWRADLLGDGTDWQAEGTLGPLSFGAPLVLLDGEPVFPVPLHLLEGRNNQDEAQLTFLTPGKPRSCDLGDNVRLPTPEHPLQGVKPIADRWLTRAGMRDVLDGRLPSADAFVPVLDLWVSEPRVGIGIDRSTRTTIDGQLYLATHVRLGERTSIYMEICGFERTDLPQRRLQTLGGEHRMAELDFAPDTAPSLPETTITPDLTCCVIVISPLVMPDLPVPGRQISGLPGRLVSACLGKSTRIGGWDSQGRRCSGKRRGRALPLLEAIPPGSVLFMERDEDSEIVGVEINSGIGRDWGLGKVLIGTWNEETKA